MQAIRKKNLPLKKLLLQEFLRNDKKKMLFLWKNKNYLLTAYSKQKLNSY